MVGLVLAGALATAAAAPAPGTAPPADLSTAPLDRAWLLALPAVYRLEVGLHVDALRTASGRLVRLPPEARDGVSEVGTAFGVTPDGVVVTADHVAQPRGPELTAKLYRLKRVHEGAPGFTDAQALAWVRRTGARPAGVRVRSRTLRPALPVPTSAGAPVSYPATLVRGDRTRDLALLRAPLRGVPALDLNGSTEIGTPVVVLGFGGEGDFPDPGRERLVPAARRGVLGRTYLNGVKVSSAIEPGDSGGPAVDAEGDARGVVVQRRAWGGVIRSAEDVRALMREAGLNNDPGPATRRFDAAMRHFWALDFPAARAGLRATWAGDPAHATARIEEAHAQAYEAAGYAVTGPRRWDGALLALGVGSALAALACAIGLLRRRPPGGAADPSPRGAGSPAPEP